MRLLFPRLVLLLRCCRCQFAFEGPGAISVDWLHKPVDTRVGVNGELFFTTSDSGDGTVMVMRYINPQHRPVLISQEAVAGSELRSTGGPTIPLVDFSFDRDGSRSLGSNFQWANGTDPHYGLAVLDGVQSFVNLTQYNSGAGVAMPNMTGGEASYEMWFWPQAVEADNLTVLFELADNRTGGLDEVIQLGLRGKLGGNAALAVRLDSTQGSSLDFDVQNAVPTQKWTHVVVTMAARSVQVYINGALVSEQFIRMAPRRMARSSALLGKGLLNSGPSPLFYGSFDVVRVYPYPLSPPQIRLNFALSSNAVISPSFYAHFSMAPMESSEPTFEPRGPANRRLGQPPPPPFNDDGVFPGWAHFEGPGHYVDLLNPNSGVGAVWPSTFLDNGFFSIELWLRLSDTSRSNDYQVLLFADGLLQIFMEGGALGFNVSVDDTATQWAGLSIPQPNGFDRWHHVVWNCLSAQNGAVHEVHVNGQVVAHTTTPRVDVTHPAGVAYLAPVFYGDVAAFRIYPSYLSEDVVQLLYEAQMYGHQQPSTSSSSSATPSVSSSAPTAVPPSPPTSVSSSAPTSAPSPSSSPTAAPSFPTSFTTPPSLSSSAVQPGSPTSEPQQTSISSSSSSSDDSSSSTGISSTGTGGDEESSGMSTAAMVAIALVVAVLLIAAAVGAFVFIRRRRAASGSGDERTSRLIPTGDSSDSYSRL